MSVRRRAGGTLLVAGVVAASVFGVGGAALADDEVLPERLSAAAPSATLDEPGANEGGDLPDDSSSAETSTTHTIESGKQGSAPHAELPEGEKGGVPATGEGSSKSGGSETDDDDSKSVEDAPGTGDVDGGDGAADAQAVDAREFSEIDRPVITSPESNDKNLPNEQRLVGYGEPGATVEVVILPYQTDFEDVQAAANEAVRSAIDATGVELSDLAIELPDDGRVETAEVDSTGLWQTTVNFEDGAYGVFARQILDTDEQFSGSVVSPRTYFTVGAAVAPWVEWVQGDAPVVTSPTEGATVRSNTVTVTGTAPELSGIHLTIDHPEDYPAAWLESHNWLEHWLSTQYDRAEEGTGEIYHFNEDTVIADENGNWSTTLELSDGEYTLSASLERYSLETDGPVTLSQQSEPITFTVDSSTAVAPIAGTSQPAALAATGVSESWPWLAGAAGVLAAVGAGLLFWRRRGASADAQ